MKGCNRVGVELSWRCNWNCTTCFYHHDDRLHTNQDAKLEDVKRIIDKGRAGGCTHTVVVGWGEPSLSPIIYDVIGHCNHVGMTCSVITNGATGVERFAKMFDMGLDHLHVSTHGIGQVLTDISGNNHAYANQMKLLAWLRDNKKPWRSNITLQKLNCKQLEKITTQNIEYGCFHQVYLNFLPHYHWNEPAKMRTVAVHPDELKGPLERAIDIAEKNNKLITLRYFPFCKISESYRKYIVNAYYVAYDPWEWVYNDAFPNSGEQKIQQSAEWLGGVGHHSPPCTNCDAFNHCFGFNKYYIAGFENMAGIRSIHGLSEVQKQIGYYHDQNPANGLNGDTKGVF
jgi:MoaA/NifB/PqqE/SkfB family radical SAM enzyme